MQSGFVLFSAIGSSGQIFQALWPLLKKSPWTPHNSFTCLGEFTLALNPGDIAFVGFNTDGRGKIAFVAPAVINPGEVIIFEDNEWKGTPFVDTNASAFSWTANSYKDLVGIFILVKL
jgi:hypothetical protein